MPTDPCPPTADYEAMLAGHLDGPRAAALETHLEGCAACQQVLDGLAVDARLTDALRSGPVAADAPDLSEMVSRIEDMASQFTPAGFDVSASADGDDATVPADVTAIGPLGAYRIVELLGAGGMGLVYLAEDELLNRRVAVKVLPPRLARRSAARAGFLREARAVAALKHDNVVTVFQVGEAAGPNGEPIPFLAMELLEGENLADYLRREGRVPAAWAARLGAQAADALAAAHARGVVHRDVKPGNLWLEAPPGWADAPAPRPPLPAVARLKVLDFGLARPAGEDPTGGVRALGTPAYMPPEQALGEPSDERSDVFGLGVVLYEMVTGQLPYPRTDRKAPPAYPNPVPVRTLAPDVPSALAELIHRAIRPDPAARPQTAAEVARALTALAERPAPRRRTAVLVAGLAVLLVGAVAVGAWVRWGRTESPSADEADGPAFRPGEPDDAWCAAVAALPPDRQLAAVTAKLRELNPDYDGQVMRYASDGSRITEFAVFTDAVADIRPVRALPKLTSLNLNGTAPGRGKLTDLSPLRGLPLTVLNVWQNPALRDLSPAQGMKLVLFQAGDTAVDDLSPLAGMPLGTLAVNDCKVHDLTPVQTMSRLRFLRCDGCPVTSLEPLVGSTVRELTFTFDPARGDEAVLERLNLDRVNRRPLNELRGLPPR